MRAAPRQRRTSRPASGRTPARRRLAAGKKITDCRDLRGVACLPGSKETLPPHEWHDAGCDNRTVLDGNGQFLVFASLSTALSMLLGN